MAATRRRPGWQIAKIAVYRGRQLVSRRRRKPAVAASVAQPTGIISTVSGQWRLDLCGDGGAAVAAPASMSRASLVFDAAGESHHCRHVQRPRPSHSAGSGWLISTIAGNRRSGPTSRTREKEASPRCFVGRPALRPSTVDPAGNIYVAVVNCESAAHLSHGDRQSSRLLPARAHSASAVMADPQRRPGSGREPGSRSTAPDNVYICRISRSPHAQDRGGHRDHHHDCRHGHRRTRSATADRRRRPCSTSRGSSASTAGQSAGRRLPELPHPQDRQDHGHHHHHPGNGGRATPATAAWRRPPESTASTRSTRTRPATSSSFPAARFAASTRIPGPSPLPRRQCR